MFYTVGQRTKWQRVLYVILPILSVALIIQAYALVQQKMPLLLPDAKGLWERFIRTFTHPIKDVNLIGAHRRESAPCADRAVVCMDARHRLWRFDWLEPHLQGIVRQHFRAVPSDPADRMDPDHHHVVWHGEFPKVLDCVYRQLYPGRHQYRGGIRMVEKEYIDVGRVFGASRSQLLAEFVVPTALPSIFAGVRTSVSCAWTVVLAAEMLGADHGVGALVTRGWNAGDMALVFVSIICIGIIGALLAFVLNKLEKVVCPWNR